MPKAYLIPTFHHDIAYLKPEAEYTARCLEILDEALDILEAHPEYRFFFEQAWLLEVYFDARPQNRRRMRALARERRLALEPALYAVPDMSMPSGESMYMQATIGGDISERLLGTRPRVCMIADCWGHHAQLPQILTQCGYEYYSFSRCMREDVNVQNFIWRGADGSKLRAHWLSTHYEGIGFPNAKAENAEELEWASSGAQGIRALMERNARHCGNDAQYLPVGGDMCFPSALAPDLIKRLNARRVLPKLEFALPDEALDNIDWQNAPEFGGEFESSQQGSFTTSIHIKQRDREHTRALYSLEALAALTRADIDFTHAWKLHLKNEFHDILCGTICDAAFVDVEADARALKHTLTSIQRALTHPMGEPALFNALPFDTRVIIEDKQGARAVDVPAFGFKALADAVQIAKAEAKRLPFTFENEWYTARVGADGYIESLTPRACERELVSECEVEGKYARFGAITMQVDDGDSWWALSKPRITRDNQGYRMNRPDPLENPNTRTILPTVLSARVIVSDAERVVIEQKCHIKFWITEFEYTTTTTLSRSKPEIAYHTEFTNHARNARLRAAFPVTCAQSICHQIPYALIERGEGEQVIEMFIDAQDERAGLALISRGIPAANVQDNVMMLSMFRSTAMEYKCESKLTYLEGRAFAFDYAILPHAPDADALIWRRALDFITPPVLTTIHERARAMRVTSAQLSCIRNTDHGLFLRLYNPAPTPTTARVCVEGARQWRRADGLMRPIAAASAVNDENIDIELGAWKVENILILD